MSEAEPIVSIVVTTYERPESAREAVASVFDARLPVSFEVVIVDDGSGPASAALLDDLLEPEPNVRVVRQENAGLTAARILGVAASKGSWLAFLDDDDRILAGWSELADRVADGPAIASGAARLCRPDGSMIRDDPPRPLGPIFDGVTAQYLAGSFVVRRDVYERAGGYLPGLSCSHQTELFIRCAAVCREQGLTVASTTTPVVRIERRDESDRVLSNPRLLYDGTRWILSRHATRFALDRVERSNWEGVAAVNAARSGDPMARRHALRSVRDNPSNLRAWARLAAIGTPLRSRMWRGAAVTQRLAESQRSPLRQAASFAGTDAAALCASSDFLFLPWRYRENPPVSSDAGDRTYWSESGHNSDVRLQEPVYRWAERLVRGRRLRVLDVGCGAAEKFVRRVAPHAAAWWGVDQASGIGLASRHTPGGNWIAGDITEVSTWERLEPLRPDLVLCVDVIEHVVDPAWLLERLSGVLAPGGRLLLSTPDRSRLDDRDPLGPPTNPRHIREWTEAEMRLLVEAAGFEVLRSRQLLPRSYSPTLLDLKRVAYRILHGMAVPDRRSCTAFLLRVRQ